MNYCWRGKVVQWQEFNSQRCSFSNNVLNISRYSSFGILQVKWPHILLHDAWTSLHFHLHYHHLLQFAVIPRESFNTPEHYSSIEFLLKPLALSTKLDLSGVAALKLRLNSHSSNSLEYRINCEEGEREPQNDWEQCSYNNEQVLLTIWSSHKSMTILFTSHKKIYTVLQDCLH